MRGFHKSQLLGFSALILLSFYTGVSEAVNCYQCNSYSPSNTEQENADCAAGVNITHKVVDCEEEGWGSSCIARVLKFTSTGNEIWIRSCVSPPPMTCDPGLDDSGAAGPVWTLCCDEDHCNNYDPRDDMETTEVVTSEPPVEETTSIAVTEEPSDGVRCYQCNSYSPSNTEQ